MSPDFPIVLTLLSDFLSKWFWECGKTFQNSLPHHVTSTLPGGPILEKNLFSIQSVTILGHQKNTSDWNSEQKPKQVSYLYTFIAIFLESNMPDVSKKIIHSNLKSTCSEWRAAKTSKEIPQNVNPNIWAERPTGFQNYTRKIQLCNILGKILPNLQKPFQDTKEGKK